MKPAFAKISLPAFLLFSSLASTAQGIDYDPEKNKIIPDKVFEIGLPLLALMLLVNLFFTLFKTRMENRLKEKALDKNLSEAALIALFSESSSIGKSVYLKWFIILLSIGLSFFAIHFISQWTNMRSPYIAGGILCVFLSIGFLIYHRMLGKS
jgi:hypothetical protein